MPDEAVRRPEGTLTSPLSAARVLREVDEAIMVTDAGGTISFWNAAAERLYGWSEAEVLGRNAADLFLPEHKAPEAAAVRERLAAGETWESEWVLRRRDGSTFTALVTDTPVLGDDGTLTAIIAVSRDMSGVRATEQALVTTERRFQALVESSGDLLAVTDADAVIRMLAGPTAELLGVPAQALLGRSMFDLVRTADLERARRLWSQRTATKEAMEAEDYWTQRADGAWICLSLKAANRLDDPAVAGIVVTLRDVTETRHRDSARSVIAAANGALMLARSERDLFSEICRIVVADETYNLAWVGINDSARPLGVRVLTVGGIAAGYLDAVERAFAGARHHAPVQDVLDTNEPYVVQDVEQLPESSPFRQLLLDHGQRSLVLLPLHFGKDDFGVLAIYSPRTNAFSDDAIGVLHILAGDIVYGIEAIRTREEHDRYRLRFEASLEAAVRAIATAAELRDPYTAGHQRRVAQLATSVATVLGIDAQLVTGIGVAASIHDIGKLVVPAEILAKPGHLTGAEFEIVKQHSQVGYDIVHRIDFPWPAPDMILQHHERLDGSGYPNGLRGEEIGLGGRIIAIADVVEAMSSHRPYRPGLGVDAALHALADGRGTLFYPEGVDACLHLFSDDGFTFAEPTEERT